MVGRQADRGAAAAAFSQNGPTNASRLKLRAASGPRARCCRGAPWRSRCCHFSWVVEPTGSLKKGKEAGSSGSSPWLDGLKPGPSGALKIPWGCSRVLASGARIRECLRFYAPLLSAGFPRRPAFYVASLALGKGEKSDCCKSDTRNPGAFRFFPGFAKSHLGPFRRAKAIRHPRGRDDIFLKDLRRMWFPPSLLYPWIVLCQISLEGSP